MTDFHSALDSLGDTPFRAYLYPHLYLDETPFDNMEDFSSAMSHIRAVRDSGMFPDYVSLSDGFSDFTAVIQDRKTGEYYGREYREYKGMGGWDVVWVDPHWFLYHKHEVTVTQFHPACHCGEPVVFGYDGDPSHTRGLCADCDAVRCDAYPGECGK